MNLLKVEARILDGGNSEFTLTGRTVTGRLVSVVFSPVPKADIPELIKLWSEQEDVVQLKHELEDRGHVWSRKPGQSVANKGERAVK